MCYNKNTKIRPMTKDERDRSRVRSKVNKGENTMLDNTIVSSPDHYSRWKIEPITFVMMNSFEFWRGNIIKYASRAGYKKYDNMNILESEMTDLKKVIRYCEMRINELKGEDVL
tara:strand:+ start:510 stop:851 length:342 start_codon:yes stop_codon:yes gene_type:complete